MTENSTDVHIDVLLALRVRAVRMNGVGCLLPGGIALCQTSP